MNKKVINVLSAFNGMGCIWIALENLGIKVGKRYSSEIDKHANKVNDAMYPDTIQLGSIVDVRAKDLDRIDLFTFGSPCQGFSMMGKGLNFKDPRSALFFEAVRLLKEIRETNPNVLFLMENVAMKRDHEMIISRYLNVKPIYINSRLVSAQNRKRLYWTNIYNGPQSFFGDMECMIPQPKDKGILLKDILEKNVDEKYFLKDNQLKWWKGGYDAPIDEDKIGCLKFGRTEEAKKICRDSKKTHGKDYSPFQEKKIVGIDYEKMNTITTSKNRDNLIIQASIPIRPQVQMVQRPHGANKGLEVAMDGKTPSMTASQWQHNNLLLVKNKQNPSIEYRIRRLTPRECGRLQAIPEKKLDIMLNCGVSENQLYRQFGNGWTVSVIEHILSFMEKK